MAKVGSASPPRPARSGVGGSLQEKLPKTLETIAQSLPAGTKRRVRFQDEGRFGRIRDARCGWAPLPLRPAVGSQIVREFVYAYAAVRPADGPMASLILPWVDARPMSLFPAHTAAQFPGDYGVLILDGAGWHTAQELTVPANRKLLALPPYSPELNPAEHIWEYIRENDMRNRIFGDLDEVVDVIAVSLHRLHQAPATLRSMTAFPWIVQAAA